MSCPVLGVLELRQRNAFSGRQGGRTTYGAVRSFEAAVLENRDVDVTEVEPNCWWEGGASTRENLGVEPRKQSRTWGRDKAGVLKLFLKYTLWYFFHYRVSPYICPPQSPQLVVHVHESFFLFARSLHSLTSPSQ